MMQMKAAPPKAQARLKRSAKNASQSCENEGRRRLHFRRWVVSRLVGPSVLEATGLAFPEQLHIGQGQCDKQTGAACSEDPIAHPSLGAQKQLDLR